MTEKMPNKDGLLTTEDLHKLTGFSKRFWETRRISGDTPPFLRISARSVRYRWGDVEQWLNSMKYTKSPKRLKKVMENDCKN